MSHTQYKSFSAYFALTDPWYPVAGCGHSGKVEFHFTVDDVIVFSSGIVTGIEQEEPIFVEFDMPINAQTLTIFVLDGGDWIGCDHWTIGDARLLRR